MSDTPRTDAVPFMPTGGPFVCIDGVCYGEHSLRKLLDEYAAVRAECEGLKAQYREAVYQLDRLRGEADKADRHVHEVEEIGQLVGCNHVEGLARCVKDRIEELETERDGYKHSANFRRDRGITLLDAKYLDPACHKGCQSLVWQEQVLAGIAAEDYAIKSHLITADLLEVTAAERDKLKGFYDEIVKELGHDCVLRELRDAKARADRAEAFITRACQQGLPNLTFHSLNTYLLEVEAELTALREDKADLDWLQHDPQNRFVRAVSTWMKVGSNGVITIRDAIRAARKDTL